MQMKTSVTVAGDGGCNEKINGAEMFEMDVNGDVQVVSDIQNSDDDGGCERRCVGGIGVGEVEHRCAGGGSGFEKQFIKGERRDVQMV